MVEKLNRRDFLRLSALAAAGVTVAACAKTPTEAPKEPTKAPEKTAAPPTATPVPVKEVAGEAPMLASMVEAGTIPALEERLPEEPTVIVPAEEVGQYGGTWHRLAVGPGDIQFPARLAYDNLVRYNIDGSKVIPNAAKSWEVLEGGKVYTFTLRKGMKWSNGDPFTADDIVFYYKDHMANTEISPTFSSTWSPGGKPMVVDKIDDYTVRFTFAVPDGLFMVKMPSANGLAFTLYPSEYLKQFHASYAKKEELDAMVREAGFEFWYELYNNKGGNMWGACKENIELPTIHAWILKVPAPEQPVVFERNPYFYKTDTEGNQLPYIDTVEHMIVEDKELLNMKAVSGEVDMQLRHMVFTNYPLFQENKEKGDYRVLQWVRGYITDTVIAPNVAHKDPAMRELLDDKRFRWALSLGIKRDEIIESVYLGMAEPNQVSPLPTSPHYWEEQAKNLIDYDPDQANQLLDEMGLTERDADGYRLRKDGQRVSITYEYTPIFGSWGDIGELLSAQWKELGIELNVEEEARSLFYERKAANEHDMGVWTGSAEFNPLIDPRWFLPFSAESVHAVPFAAWWNSGGKEGEEPPADLRKAQEIFDEIKQEPDTEKQKTLFRQILELNKENLWVIGVSTAPPEVVVVKNFFRNVPESAVSDWHLLTPGATAPEQYYIKA